MVETGWPQMTI